MKKLLSSVLAGILAVQSAQYIVIAADSGCIQVGSVSVNAGETFELPIELEKNPGITALSLNLTYDASKLELLGAADGKILGTSTFLSGDDLSKIPYIMNWDDLSTENNTGTGTLATLSFRSKAGSAGDTEVSVSVNQKSTFNVDLEDVPFDTVGGKVSIAADEKAPAIIADTVSGNTGDTVKVPIRLQNNPGVAALSMSVSYDNIKLKLLGVEDGKLLGTSTFLSGDDLSKIPYIMNWDDLSTENNTGNGILAVLSFEVLAEDGSASVGLSVNQRSTFNVDLEEVSFSVTNGTVQIGENGTVTTSRSEETSHTTETTLSDSMSIVHETSDSTETEKTTTCTTSTSSNLPEEAAIIVDNVYGNQGDSVNVPIRIHNNPGIAALSLGVVYDNTKLKLLGVSDGKILGSSTFLASDDLTRIPFILNWDDLSTVNNTGNGITATLTFEVLATEGSVPIEIIVNQPSTFNIDLQEVAFTVVNGSVIIDQQSSSTTTEPSLLKGDFSGNGVLNISDAVLCIRYLAEDNTISAKTKAKLNPKAADFDNDGSITIFDVSSLLTYLADQGVQP